jgi:hypothetical protein
MNLSVRLAGIWSNCRLPSKFVCSKPCLSTYICFHISICWSTLLSVSQPTAPSQDPYVHWWILTCLWPQALRCKIRKKSLDAIENTSQRQRSIWTQGICWPELNRCA